MSRFQILSFALLLGCNCTHKLSATTGPTAAKSSDFKYRNTVDVGEVDPDNMVNSYVEFAKIADRGEKEITLRIDSFGGQIFLGNRWIRVIEDMKKERDITVTCIVDGAAYSMAAVILESPVCDIRLATERSTILFHNGSSGAKGTAVDLRNTAAHLEALNESMAMMISKRLGLTLEDYRERIAYADWVMAVNEALETRVIDGIAHPSEIAPPSLE